MKQFILIIISFIGIYQNNYSKENNQKNNEDEIKFYDTGIKKNFYCHCYLRFSFFNFYI